MALEALGSALSAAAAALAPIAAVLSAIAAALSWLPQLHPALAPAALLFLRYAP